MLFCASGVAGVGNFHSQSSWGVCLRRNLKVDRQKRFANSHECMYCEENQKLATRKASQTGARWADANERPTYAAEGSR